MDNTVILVDDNDNVIGYEKKEVAHSGNGKRHRAITLLLFNKNGQTLLQRRKHKRWDDVWDIAGATDLWHVNGRNETYEESAHRCMKKEWGVTTDLKNLFTFNYFERYGDMCENECCALLVGNTTESVKHNPDVAYGHKWVSLKELARNIEKTPQEYTPWAIIAIKQFLNHQEGKKFLK